MLPLPADFGWDEDKTRWTDYLPITGVKTTYSHISGLSEHLVKICSKIFCTWTSMLHRGLIAYPVALLQLIFKNIFFILIITRSKLVFAVFEITQGTWDRPRLITCQSQAGIAASEFTPILFPWRQSSKKILFVDKHWRNYSRSPPLKKETEKCWNTNAEPGVGEVTYVKPSFEYVLGC